MTTAAPRLAITSWPGTRRPLRQGQPPTRHERRQQRQPCRPRISQQGSSRRLRTCAHRQLQIPAAGFRRVALARQVARAVGELFGQAGEGIGAPAFSVASVSLSRFSAPDSFIHPQSQPPSLLPPTNTNNTPQPNPATRKKKKKKKEKKTNLAYSNPANLNLPPFPPLLSPAPVRQNSQHRSAVMSPGATRLVPSARARAPVVSASAVVSL
jgi:hypothetical protein